MAQYLYQVGLVNKVYMSHGREQRFLVNMQSYFNRYLSKLTNVAAIDTIP